MLFIHPNLVALRSIKSCLPRDVLVLSLQLINNKKVSRTLDQFLRLKMTTLGGCIAQWIAFLLLTQQPRVWFSAFPRFFRNFLMLLRFINSSALLRAWTVQNKCLIVNRTHLVLACGKLVLQKWPFFQKLFSLCHFLTTVCHFWHLESYFNAINISITTGSQNFSGTSSLEFQIKPTAAFH